MEIAILGAGNIGGTLGKRWAEAGHKVTLGVRDPGSPKAQGLQAELPAGASLATIAQAVEGRQVVLLAIPWSAVDATLQPLAEALAGKIIVDATNNFGRPVANNIQTILDRVPSVQVFRAFNALGWEVFARPQIGGESADLFYCGPDGEPQAVVERLISDLGMRPVWVGGLDQVALVDNLGALWVNLAFRRGLGRRLAFRMLLNE